MKISDLKGNIGVVYDASGSTQIPQVSQGVSGVPGIAVGATKGVASTALGIGGIGQKIQHGIGSLIGMIPGVNVSSEAKGDNSLFNPKSTAGAQVQSFVAPQGTAENIGFGTEKFAEYFLPASQAAKTESLVNVLAQGIKSPLLAATTRVVGKSLVQGTASGIIQAAQSGGDISKTLQTATTAGILRGGFATIGEGARAIRLPEKLYSTIFKTSASDMMDELRTENLVNLQKTDPAKYANLISHGIVKDTPTGPILNETIAKQALDSGLKGSIRDMARTVINGALDSETKVQNTLANYTGKVDLTEPQFVNVLKGISKRYKNVGFNEISNEADRLSAVIKASGGNVDGITALQVRRLLDSARIASSFDAPATSLSLGQSNLKTLADVARSRLNAIPDIGDIMSKYSFYIDAIDTLAKEASRRGNNQALSLIDSLFLSSAFGGNNMIPGVTAGVLRKILTSGHGTTVLARLLNASTASGTTSGLTGASSGLMTRATNSQ